MQAFYFFVFNFSYLLSFAFCSHHAASWLARIISSLPELHHFLTLRLILQLLFLIHLHASSSSIYSYWSSLFSIEIYKRDIKFSMSCLIWATWLSKGWNSKYSILSSLSAISDIKYACIWESNKFLIWLSSI